MPARRDQRVDLGVRRVVTRIDRHRGRWYQAKRMHARSRHRSLLVVGSVALDDIDGPFGLHRDLLGGSASFIARAASYFTQNVSVVAVVGDDFPQKHLDELAATGVDT